MLQLTEKHEIKISKKQKETLLILKTKYRINTSEFIRQAINEKLLREKDEIFKNYKEIQEYIKTINKCPF